MHRNIFFLQKLSNMNRNRNLQFLEKLDSLFIHAFVDLLILLGTYISHSVSNAGKIRVEWMILSYKNVTNSLVYNCPYLSSKLLQGYFYKKGWGDIFLPTLGQFHYPKIAWKLLNKYQFLKSQLFSYKIIKTFTSTLYVYREIIARHCYVYLLGNHFPYLSICINSGMAILLPSYNYDLTRFIRQLNGDSQNNVNQSLCMAHLGLEYFLLYSVISCTMRYNWPSSCYTL